MERGGKNERERERYHVSRWPHRQWRLIADCTEMGEGMGIEGGGRKEEKEEEKRESGQW